MKEHSIMWSNDRVQFARFITEAKMAGALTKTVLKDMTQSMDLSEKYLQDIITRAENIYHKAVRKGNSPCPIPSIK